MFERRPLLVSLLVALAAVAAAAGPTVATAQGHAPATITGTTPEDASRGVPLVDGATVDPPTVRRHVAPGERTANDAVGGAAAEIRVERRLARLPDSPGEMRVTLSASVPDGVTQLALSLPEQVTAVTASDGFQRADGGRYEWTGAADPSLTVRVAVNRSAGGSRFGDGGGYAFVDTGAWTLAQVPGVGVGWTERAGTAATVVRTTSVVGEGATGGEIAYLGPVERYERTAAGQSFTLAVPERASLGPDPATVLDSLTAAADALRIGDRDAEVFVLAAPQGEVEWGVRGLQTGPNDAWVVADEPVADPANVWLHEYVHTRQDFETTASGRWLAEASADYFAALLTLQQERIDYAAFRDQLAIGTRSTHRDAVLSDPTTWEGRGSNYRKGALVLGALDRRLRLATDGARDLESVVTELNRADGPVSTATFVDTLADGDGDLAAVAERYTTTEAVPETWTASEHAAAFDGSPAAVELAGVTATLAGPYRNRTVAIAGGDPPRLAERPVVGERVVLEATLANAGGSPGTYDLALTVDGVVADRRTGTLAPGERTTVRFVVEVTERRQRLRIGGRELVVEGLQPATASVTGLAVEPDEIGVGERTTVTTTVTAPEDRPARRTVTVRVGERVVEERTVWLDAGERRALSVTVEATTAGRFDVAVGELTRRLVVGDPTATASGASGGGSGSGSVPAPGPALAALAVLVTVVGAAWRRRR